MGRTLPSASMIVQQEIQRLEGFKLAMSPRDQRALEDLQRSAQLHVAEVAYAADPLPFQMMLLCMLLETHKEMLCLRNRIDSLEDQVGSQQKGGP